MRLRGKSRRRLLFLLIAVLAVGTLVGGAAGVRLVILHRRALRGRSLGMEAMKQGDYTTALQELGRYLSRNPNDADVLLPYAKARGLVAEPQGANLVQAISLYQRVLELHPGMPKAQDELLDLYIQVGFSTEASSLADSILARPALDSATEIHALRSKAIALLRMRKIDEARKSMDRLVKLSPDDLDIRILAMQVMQQKETPAQIVQKTDQLALQHPNDDRFQLLRSIADTLAGDSAKAKSIVLPLASHALLDAAYTRMLIRQLDNVSLYPEAFAVIEKAARNTADPQTLRIWYQRLFETGQFARLVDQTQKLDPASSATDIETLVVRAMALMHLDRKAEAMAIVNGLEKQSKTNALAAVWAAALRGELAGDTSADPIKRISLLRDTLISSPENPILLEQLAEAYSDAGVTDKAVVTWRQVTQVAPEWAAPLMHLSRFLLSVGRQADALAAARAAQLRAPDDHDAAFAVALASAAGLPAGPSPDADKVLALLDKLQQQFPRDQDALPLKVHVLAQMKNRDAAIAAIHAALKLQPPPPEAVLLSLAQTSSAFGFGLEDECWSASQKAHGMTPELAIARAGWLLAHKRTADATTLVEKACAAHRHDKAWENLWAVYLDQIGDPRAKNQWITLGDANPTDVGVQWGAVAARSVQDDHDFVGRTIGRLTKLLGNDNTTLRLLRARWYLHGNPSEDDATQAAILLSDVSRAAPDMLAPRLLLATCYMRLGNTSGAIDELTSAADAHPDLASVAIQAARLLQSHGDTVRARQYIDRACQSKHATPDDIRQAASLLALQGSYADAAALLEKLDAADKQLPPDLMLASLYRQLNQPEKASEICARLMEKPDARAIAFCADFYASQGRTADAKAALAKLDTLKLPPGGKDVIMADYMARHGTPAATLAELQAAVKAQPKEPIVWRKLVAYCLATGDIESALTAAGEASRNLPSVIEFTTLVQNAPLIKDARSLATARPLVMSIGDDPTVNAPVLDAIRLLVSANRSSEAPAQTALKLRPLADRNLHVLALQTAATQCYIDSGQLDKALELTTRTAQAFPSSAEALRMQTTLLGAQHRWNEALGAAEEWRRHDSGETIDADLAIAGAELQLGDVAAANQQIQPYLDRAMQDPSRFANVLLLRARALLARHQPDQVEKLLGPLLEKSARVRAIWITLATESVDDSKRAQAWLDRVAALTPDNPGEKTALAQGWLTLGSRWSDQTCREKGRSLLNQVLAGTDPPIQAMLLMGMDCERVNDLPGADAAYRRALKADPENTLAMNNLANVLVHEHSHLDEALQLIDKTLARYPKEPMFLDTEAAVQAAQKNYTAATTTLRTAQSLDPTNFEWRVNLLAILVNAGETKVARNEIRQIDSMLPTFNPAPPALHQRYDDLRARVH